MGTFSNNLLLSLLAFGESAANGFDNWGDSANANFNRLDAKLGGKTTISLAGSDVTLSATAEATLFFTFTGSLSGDRVVNISARPGFWMVSNETTGAHTVTLLPSGGAGAEIPAGKSIVYSDGSMPVLFQSGGSGQTSETLHEETSTTLSSAATRDITDITPNFRAFQIQGDFTSITSNPGETGFQVSLGNGATWFNVASLPLATWSNSGTTGRQFLARIDNLTDPSLSIWLRSVKSNIADELYANITPAQYAPRPITALRFRVVPSSGSTILNIGKFKVVGIR